MIKAILRNTINGDRIWLETQESGWTEIHTFGDFYNYITNNKVEMVIIEADHRYVPSTRTNSLICYAIDMNLYYDTKIIDNDHKWTHKNLPPTNLYLTCIECGKSDETVGERIDPYDLELHGIENEIIVCTDCYNFYADEI